MENQNKKYLESAQRVLNNEAEALFNLAKNLDNTFCQAIDAILQCKGRLIVIGMGKSGHIGSKIAATLASTGTPAFFVHPAEAAHGDLGMIVKDDIVLAISFSGESDEILTILPALKRKGILIIAITGNPSSSLAKYANIHLETKITKEACPYDLAPTTSTTTALALGDALAVSLLEAKNFTAEDFALSHPAGRLGKRLLIRVEDLMHQGESLPKILPNCSLKEAILEISQKSLGFTAITDEQNYILGIFTDGDLRRLFDQQLDFAQIIIADVMHKQPKTILATKLAHEALHILQKSSINGLLVQDEAGKLVGALNMHDLLRARII